MQAPQDGKIAAVRSRVVLHAIDKPIGTAVGSIGAHGYVAVEIFTEDGERGIGYVRSFDLPVVRAAHAMLVPLAEGLIGTRASETVKAWNGMWRRIVLHGRSGVQAYPVAALDTGCGI